MSRLDIKQQTYNAEGNKDVENILDQSILNIEIHNSKCVKKISQKDSSKIDNIDSIKEDEHVKSELSRSKFNYLLVVFQIPEGLKINSLTKYQE